jgi:HAD superfamily hydrolase (TIGR01509 family)
MAGSRRGAHLNGREIDAVLIDAGGVLVDPNWLAIADVLARHGLVVDPEALRAAEPFSKRELDETEHVTGTDDFARRERFLARWLRHAGVTDTDPSPVEAATDEIEARHLARGLWEIVLDGAPEALDRMRAAGLKLSLASNAEPQLRQKLADLDLAHRFDHLAISGEMEIEKPDPRFFTTALEAIDVPPDRALHVGDIYTIDVVGARDAGLEAVLVDVAYLSADRDVLRIRSLAELPTLIGIGE